MRCSTTDIEIETIFSRINSKDFNLQPDFQRGEVWSSLKKKKLIDSILRGWRIPPIHVIENKQNFVDEVLDGQQRLVTIRDFMKGKIRIDGKLLPIDKNINSLNGLTFLELDADTQRKFKKYSVTIIRLSEYTPEEPAELFYRLNQPAALTSAEQRNAFFGDTRDQIKNLVNVFEQMGAKKNTIGFSNSRMAYDDIISKFCYMVELETIQKKITSNEISDRYRRAIPFSEKIYREVEIVLVHFMNSVKYCNEKVYMRISFNKATLLSWFIFVKRYKDILSEEDLSSLIMQFEFNREYVKGKEEISLFSNMDDKRELYKFYDNMFLLFNQRASVGNSDVTSVIFRDLILEIFFMIKFENIITKHQNLLSDFIQAYDQKPSIPLTLEYIAKEYSWGNI